MEHIIDLSDEGCKKAFDYFKSNEFKQDCINENKRFIDRYNVYMKECIEKVLSMII
jgi:hypothetical protein